VADRPAGRDGLRRGDNGVGVDTVVAVEVGQRSGLPEVLDDSADDGRCLCFLAWTQYLEGVYGACDGASIP
jgi:hypothetical protein